MLIRYGRETKPENCGPSSVTTIFPPEPCFAGFSSSCIWSASISYTMLVLDVPNRVIFGPLVLQSWISWGLHAVEDPKTKKLCSRRLQGSSGNSFEEINAGTTWASDPGRLSRGRRAKCPVIDLPPGLGTHTPRGRPVAHG